MNTSSKDQRISRLAAAAAERSAATRSRAQRSINKLRNKGQPITFVSVAREAEVSTSFLYQNTDLRNEIVRHRRINTSPAPKASNATTESLRTKLSTALESNKRLTEQVDTLRLENQALRSRLLDEAHRRSS